MILKSKPQTKIKGRLSGVALLPSSGEFVYSTTPTTFNDGLTVTDENTNWDNAQSGKTNLVRSLDNLESKLPTVKWVSLITSWFGDDLRLSECTIKPKGEKVSFNSNTNQYETANGTSSPNEWVVGGQGRTVHGTPSVISDGNTFSVAYGGTPSDRSIIEAIQEMKSRSMKVMFYPFILMDITSSQALPDPSGGTQGAYPWRGRIRPLDTENGTSAVTQQMNDFFGSCSTSDFTKNYTDQTVDYTGTEEWGLRRFTLHYAHLCALAGGVDAFCIATEMVGITSARDGDTSFPAVSRLIQLANDVRTILGDEVEITYASDWSEFMPRNYNTSLGFNSIFNLDPLWKSSNIDFVGIDNYLPLSDWRDSNSAIDNAAWPSIYSMDYLKSQIEGGERYDYYYASSSDRDNQTRTALNEWRYRDKDHKSWWSNEHYDIIGGVTQTVSTGFVPQLKRIVYTEYGCAAIDKGANQPNKFLDPKSAESSVPYYSTGDRDDRMQQSYYQAMTEYWDGSSGNNPISSITSQPMIDNSMMFAWTWDARPWPAFPRLTSVWSDGANYGAGHWLQGRQWIEKT